jgi:hypothetical protein
MADSGPPGAGNLPLDICVESPHQDGSNDTMEVMEEVELSLLEYLSRSVTSSPGVTMISSLDLLTILEPLAPSLFQTLR